VGLEELDIDLAIACKRPATSRFCGIAAVDTGRRAPAKASRLRGGRTARPPRRNGRRGDFR
jgi:hypothetical protein